MTLLSQNSKMRRSGGDKYSIYNFGIPAFQSRDGTRTCPNAGKCAIGCYARQGAYLWSNVIDAYEARLEATEDARGFHEAMLREISTKALTATKRGKTLVIRVHDSGDFYSKDYFETWLGIIRAFPQVKFYSYTKQVAMLQNVELPPNFKLTFSYGGKQDHLIKATDSVSRVFKTKTELVSAGYKDTSTDDSYAFNGRGLRRVGLVYHGTKGFDSTQWGRV